MTLIFTPGCRLISSPVSGEVVSKHFKFPGNFQPLLIPNLLIQVVLHIGLYLFFIEPDHLFNWNIWQGIHFVQNLLELGILTKETIKTLVFDLIPYCSDTRLFKVCAIISWVDCSWPFLISDTAMIMKTYTYIEIDYFIILFIIIFKLYVYFTCEEGLDADLKVPSISHIEWVLKSCAPPSLWNNKQESVSSSFVHDFGMRSSAPSAVFDWSGICSSMISRWDFRIFELGLTFCFFLQKAIFMAPVEDQDLRSQGCRC